MSNPHPIPHTRANQLCFWDNDQESNYWRSYRYDAKRRGLAFELDKELFRIIIRRPCYYCGRAGGGVDRVDSSAGYIFGNVVPCCKICNLGKREQSHDDFVRMCHLVASRHPLADSVPTVTE